MRRALRVVRAVLLGVLFVAVSPVVLVGWLLFRMWMWLRVEVAPNFRLDVGRTVRVMIGDSLYSWLRGQRWLRVVRRKTADAWEDGWGRNLILGLPAVAVAVAIGTFYMLGSVWSPEAKQAAYRGAAFEAMRGKDYATAELYFRGLMDLEGARADTRFAAALAVEALGDPQRAQAMMTSLAPPERAGYAPAHLALAQLLWNQGPRQVETLETIEQHLLRVLEAEPDSAKAHCLLGQLYLESHYATPAASHLSKGVQKYPQVAVELARLLTQQGYPDQARTLARRAGVYFAARVRAEPTNEAMRLQQVDAAMFLEDFAKAVQVLEQGLAVAELPSYRRTLAGVYWVWAEKASRDPKVAVADRLKLVEQALHYDAAHPVILQNLVAATRHGTQALPPPVMDLIRRRLAKGSAPAGLYLVAGTSAWRESRRDEAREYLEEAYELAPTDAEVANNLALVLAESEPADLSRALKLSEFALVAQPRNENFQDTHERIRKKRQVAGFEPADGSSALLQ